MLILKSETKNYHKYRTKKMIAQHGPGNGVPRQCNAFREVFLTKMYTPHHLSCGLIQ
jgi:hypothetical protein